MTTEVSCPDCGYEFFPTHRIGQSVRCPECASLFNPSDAPTFDEGGSSTRFYSASPREDLYLAEDEIEDEEEGEEDREPVEVELLKEENPELYGALLSANQKLDSAGGTIIVVALALGGLACLSAAQKWVDALFGANCDFLREWWGYVGIMVVALIIGGVLSENREQRVFASLRPELFALMDEAGISKYVLVATLEESEKLAKIAELLKKD